MSKQFTFRVDAIEGVTRESIKSFLSELACNHVVAYEISDKTKKPHYQGWVWTDLSNQTLQNRIKTAWPSVKGVTRGRTSGKYSAAPVRTDTWEAYCLKGTPTELPDVVSAQLAPFETLDIDNIHRQWWSKQASAPPRAQHIVQEGIAVFQSYEWSSYPDDMLAQRKEVAEWLINKYEGKGINSFLMKNYINGILCVTTPEYKKQYIDQLAYTDRW